MNNTQRPMQVLWIDVLREGEMIDSDWRELRLLGLYVLRALFCPLNGRIIVPMLAVITLTFGALTQTRAALGLDPVDLLPESLPFSDLLEPSAATAPVAAAGSGVPGSTTGKFEVTPTGAATYSIPISVPPGTAGTEPKLALRYSNQGGNGLLGTGWMMSGLSSITRCPATLAQDGFIDGVDFDANDRLCLDGQRLVAVSGTYGGPSTEYRTEIESFAKVTVSGGINDPNSTFEVRTKSGLIYTYGDSSFVTKASFQAPGRIEVYVWAVKEIRDTAGNYLTVTYERDLATSESYIDRIEYTGNLSAGLLPYNRVQFNYDATRPDVAERYLAGGSNRIRAKQRLISIETYTNSQSQPVRAYLFSYETGIASSRSRPTSITECATSSAGTACLSPTVFTWQEKQSGYDLNSGYLPKTDLTHDDGYYLGDLVDVNGDGRPDWVQAFDLDGRQNRTTWINTGIGWQVAPAWALPTVIYAEEHSLGEFADVNADGLPDFVYARAGNNKTYLNTGSGFNPVPDPKYQLPKSLFAGGNEKLGRLIDINGDGLVDFVYSFGAISANKAYINQAPGTCASTCWVETPAYALKGSLIDAGNEPVSDLADITGDGLPDHLIAVDNGGGNWTIATWINTGSGWLLQTNRNLPEPIFRETDIKRRVGEIADVNGDGLADFVVAYRNTATTVLATTYINKGNGWVADLAYKLPRALHSITIGTGRTGMLADINADGMPDLVVSKEGYVRETYIAKQTDCTGTSCRWQLNASQISPFLLFDSSGRVRGTIADVNGDAITDYVAAHDGSRATYISRGKAPDLIASITNGLGAVVGIDYSNLSDPAVYTRGSAAVFPNQDSVAPITVAKNHAATNGIGGINAVTYQYAGLQLNLQGRGMLGFASVSSTEATSGITELSNYRLDFPFTGMALDTTTTHSAAGRILKKTTSTPFLASSNCGGYGSQFPLVSTSKQENYEIQPFFSYIAKTQTTDYQYDGCGNALTVTVVNYKGAISTQDRHVSRSVNNYSGNPGNWILGRLSRTEVTNTLPNGANLKRVSSFTYDLNTGFLISETVEPATSVALTTTYAYDLFGNKTSVTVGSNTATPRTTTYSYEPLKARFVRTITNALGHTETHAYDAGHGGRTSLKGPNNLTTTWQYDPFGRVTLETRPNLAPYPPITTTTSYLWCGSLCVNGGVMAIRTTGSDGSDSLTALDVLEREISSGKKGFNGSWIHSLSEYDAQGRKSRVSAPRYNGDSEYWTEFAYDVLDRVIQQESDIDENTPSGLITRFSYYGLDTIQTDANNNDTVKRVNSIGRTIYIMDEFGGITQYGYDPFGNLVVTTDAAGNVISMSYDRRGRKIAMVDPDMGSWSYVNNVFGELIRQTNANGKATNMAYDMLGRMTRRNEPEGVTTWTYDAAWKGALNYVVAPAGYEQQIQYDGLGRPYSVRTRLDGTDYSVQTTFDAQSRPETLTYPGAFKIKHVYNTHGYHTEVRRFSTNALLWKLDHIDAFDNVDMETAGNGLSTSRHYDQARGHVDAIITGPGGGTSLQSLSYEWDPVGNLTKRIDQNQGGLNEAFDYDELNRLKRTKRNGAVNLTLTYDAIGNILSKTDVGSYVYDPNKPHQLMLTSGNKPALFLYDNNGNQTSSSGRLAIYTSYDKPHDIQQIVPADTTAHYTYIGSLLQDLLASGTVAYNRSQFVYGPDRSRIKQVLSRVGGPPQNETTYYIGELYERVYQGANITHRNFLRAYGKVFAINSFFANTATEQTHYLHRDHIGSVDAITRDNGTVVERFSYDAFGKRRELNWSNDADSSLLFSSLHASNRGFTGHEHLDAVALIHMNGRVYDPVYGRFTSADPFVQFPESTQGFNRYSYVGNNPLRYTDPSGYIFGIDDAILAAIALIAVGEIADIPVLTQIGFALLCQACSVAGAAATGFAGGLISSDGDIRTAVISGATAGAATFANGFFDTAASIASDGALTAGQTVAKVVTHGTIGGVSSELSGGSFKGGFLSGGFSAGAAEFGVIEGLGGGSRVGRTVAAVVVGGTASELGGGKFANGAKTAAFLQATAEAADYFESNVGGEATLRPGENRPGDPFYDFNPDTGQQFPESRSKNVTGFNKDAIICSQGGLCSKTLNLVPGLNGGVSRTHDYWLNAWEAKGLNVTVLHSVGTMLPAAAVGYGAIIGNATQGWQNNPMVWHAISQDQDRDRD